MDVDLLRPGTVPMSPETVLWFEFLLNEDLLAKHLQKPACDPSAIELIQMFFNAMVETLKNEPKPTVDVESGENIPEIAESVQFKLSLKNLALKILSLKVAAYIKWNINLLKTLPLKTQVNLLQDLLYFTNDKIAVDILKVPECDAKSVSEPHLFALLTYHQWLLRTAMHNATPNNCLKNFNPLETTEEMIIASPENINKTLLFLRDVLTWKKIPKMLSFDCFIMLKENSSEVETNWSAAVPIPVDELHAQTHYDLGSFYFYKENYKLAAGHFIESQDLMRALRNRETLCVSLCEGDLEGYLVACSGGFVGRCSLLQQMRACVSNHYTGIINVLQQDNVYREIPISYRIILELDIQGALSSGTFTVARDFLPKIEALNLVRCILDDKPSYNSLTSTNIDTFIWALTCTWRSFDEDQRRTIKNYCLQLILNKNIPELQTKITANDILSRILDEKDEKFILKAAPQIEVPEILRNSSNWDSFEYTNKRNPKLEIKAIEQQIITSYDNRELRELLMKISSKNVSRSVWKINPRWELPIPLQSVLTSLPRGFLQDFGYVMLAKSRELMLNKDWDSSLELLEVLERELQTGSGNIVAKLSRLVTWEILLVKISKLLEEWPASQMDKQTLADDCEACLQTAESVLPRTEVMEQCAICLLNIGRWDFLASFDKRWAFFEITAAIAQSCHDFVKYKGNKKVSKDIWDLVLPVFGSPPSQAKRSNAGQTVHHDPSTNGNKPIVMSVFTRLRDSTALTMVISMLTRLYNVLRDESTLELQVDFIMLWPAVVSNANSYNTRAVCEVLKQVVTQALYYYPSNIPWLRLMGDINFANGHNEAALNYYLKSLSIATDYFNLPVRSDDHVFRRMIKSCNALCCNTQAAVLCQFLEEPDYVLAFHILAEQKLCNDAVDAYYHCFFDVNILEYLVHLHHKKGEFQRRKRAIQVIGLLEINSNNNEEIQREACNLRKSTFLRALCKQFLY